ncbi:ParA family protein [Saccharospirillum sp. HFRX-1]|uniref:ParA family protein n=1 Tax=unclassified Saccharospirillum TaxID=2633430 RepID=UPI0037111EE4
MKVVAIHSQKGGVGKTSTAIHLAHQASEYGFETLLIDLDPQASASYFLSGGESKGLKARDWLRTSVDWNDFIEASRYSGVYLLPARKSLRKLDRLMTDEASEKHLKRLLRSLKSQYDLVLIDCPPGINTVIEQAYRAAHRILVPLTPTPLCFESYQHVLEFADDNAISADKLMPFFNRVNSRLALHQQSIDGFSERFDAPTPLSIRATTEVEKMALERRAVAEIKPRHPIVRDIQSLWKTLMRELDLHH